MKWNCIQLNETFNVHGPEWLDMDEDTFYHTLTAEETKARNLIAARKYRAGMSQEQRDKQNKRRRVYREKNREHMNQKNKEYYQRTIEWKKQVQTVI